MYDRIIQVMDALSQNHQNFNANVGNEGGERAFRIALLHALNQKFKSEYEWCSEQLFNSGFSLPQNNMRLDIVGKPLYRDGQSVYIELKYHATIAGRVTVADGAAVPYNIIKDCLRLEIAACNIHPVPLCFVIALTNWSNAWSGGAGNAWSHEFRVALHRDNPIVVGQAVYETHGNNINNVRLRNGRLNVSLGNAWTGGWYDYGTLQDGANFRYLILQKDGMNSFYTHNTECYVTIPFMREDVKNNFFTQRQQYEDNNI